MEEHYRSFKTGVCWSSFAYLTEQDLENLFCQRESSPLERAVLSGLWSHHPSRVRDSVVPYGRYNPYEKDQARMLQQQVQVRLHEAHPPPRPGDNTTAAQWMESLFEQALFLPNGLLLRRFLDESRVDWWPTSVVRPFPGTGASKEKVTHPYVTSVIHDLMTCNGRAYKLKKLSRAGVLTFFGRAMCAVTLHSQPQDCRGRSSFGSWRPDIVLYDGDNRGITAITAFGLIRRGGIRGELFPDADISQIFHMGADLMKKNQFERPLLLCFLTDGNRFQFFRIIRRGHGGEFQYEYSVLTCGLKGWQNFFGLLTRPVEELGYVRLQIPGWQLVAGLGSGLFTGVYSCLPMDPTQRGLYAVKIFRGEAIEMAAWERDVLDRLRARGVINIPACVDLRVEPDFTALVVTPIGLPAMSALITPAMLRALLSVVRAAHDIGVIHRDIKPNNILVDSTDPRRVILIDWSSAVEASGRYPYVGTEIYGDVRELDVDHTPTPGLDLRCLVRTAFTLTRRKLPEPSKYRGANAYWCRITGEFPQFREAMACADALDYEGLDDKFGMW